MRRITLSIVVLAAAFVLSAATDVTAHAPGELMKKKTEHAQSILKNLAIGDLDAVKADALAIEKLTKDAGFTDKGERYAEYGAEFLRVVRELITQAEKKNLAGSYYQFTRMTGVCFSCHEHIRGNPSK